MKISHVSVTFESWKDKFVGRVLLINEDETQVNLVLPEEITAQLLAVTTKHVTKNAQKNSDEFFNGMQNVGVPALEQLA